MLTARCVDEGKIGLGGGDIAQDREHVGHGAVVERDVVVVVALERIHLRPAAVGELGGEDEIDTAKHGVAAVLATGGAPDASEEAQLFGGRVVVEGGEVVGRLVRFVLRAPLHTGLARAAAVAGVLGPAAGRGLVRQNDVGQTGVFLAGEPGVVGFVRKLEVATVRGADRLIPTEGGQLGPKRRLIGLRQGGGAGKVFTPRGLRGFGQGGDAFRGHRFGEGRGRGRQNQGERGEREAQAGGAGKHLVDGMGWGR